MSLNLKIGGFNANANVIHNSPDGNIELKSSKQDKEIPIHYHAHAGYGNISWEDDMSVVLTCRFSLAKSILNLTEEELLDMAIKEGTFTGGMPLMGPTTAVGDELMFMKSLDLNLLDPCLMVHHIYASAKEAYSFWTSYMSRASYPVEETSPFMGYMTPIAQIFPLSDWMVGDCFNRMQQNYIQFNGLSKQNIINFKTILNSRNPLSAMLGQYCHDKDLFRFTRSLSIDPYTHNHHWGYLRPEVTRCGEFNSTPKFNTGSSSIQSMDLFISKPDQPINLNEAGHAITDLGEHFSSPSINSIKGCGTIHLGSNKYPTELATSLGEDK